jgi:hypothetical protein
MSLFLQGLLQGHAEPHPRPSLGDRLSDRMPPPFMQLANLMPGGYRERLL